MRGVVTAVGPRDYVGGMRMPPWVHGFTWVVCGCRRGSTGLPRWNADVAMVPRVCRGGCDGRAGPRGHSVVRCEYAGSALGAVVPLRRAGGLCRLGGTS